VPEPNDEERELRSDLMRTQIENLKADTTYKLRLADFEPWKVVLGAFLSGAATLGAIVGLLTFILRH
jgi:RsiW-degrading membrane proteinase PrsW (M82 family)